jgi:leucyl/phenylalanyl-tRNA---protein transferase
MPVFLLSDKLTFPSPTLADSDGLLAVGGDLSPQRLLLAYGLGIFPWFSPGDPILWWSPDPRLILFPDKIRVSRSLKKIIRRDRFRVSLDTAFEDVMAACAASRRGDRGEGTWITRDMIQAYGQLHKAGFAHSIEVWHRGELAGGLYGIALGKCFFGESMFTRVSDASKVALVELGKHLVRHGFAFIDCQVVTGHLVRMGAHTVSRNTFLQLLRGAVDKSIRPGKWCFKETVS